MSAEDVFHDRDVDAAVSLHYEYLRAKRQRKSQFHGEIGTRTLRLAKVLGIESKEDYTTRDDYDFFVEWNRFLIHTRAVELSGQNGILGARLHIERKQQPLLFIGSPVARLGHRLFKTGVCDVSEVTIEYVDLHEAVRSVELNRHTFGETVESAHTANTSAQAASMSAQAGLTRFIDILQKVEAEVLPTD